MYLSLQVCRALAALMVVCLHVGATLSREGYLGHAADFLWQLTSFGDAGVPFFFVLSGFIVTHVHLRDVDQPSRLPAYLLKRAARIYPMYWLVFAMTCLFVALLPAAHTTLPADTCTLVKALLLIPQDPAVVGGTGAPMVFVAWTLQYEMVFYLAMALALIRRWLLLVPAALWLVNRLGHVQGAGFISDFFASNLFLLFAMGAGVALLSAKGWRLPTMAARALCVVAASAFLALALWTVGAFANAPRHIHALLLFGGASTLLVLGLTHLEDGGWRLSAGHVLVRLGHASYVLYLIHVAVVSALGKGVVALWLHAGQGRPMSAAAVMVVAVALVGACAWAALAVHRYIERPLMKRLNQRIAQWTSARSLQPT